MDGLGTAPAAGGAGGANGAERTFPVVERFTSVNGEGTHAGRLAAFVRFRGCALACSYCDTAWARGCDAPAEQLTVRDILAFVEASPASCVTLTGGEPLQQEGIGTLMEALLADPRRYVEVETNGAVPLDAFASLRAHRLAGPGGAGRKPSGGASGGLAFTMDCKLPSSGMAGRMVPGNYALLEPCDTVKFVIGDEGDFPAALRVIRACGLQERCHVYLSPVFGRMDPARIVEFMRDNGLDRATLQLQLHKIVWPGVEKGV